MMENKNEIELRLNPIVVNSNEFYNNTKIMNKIGVHKTGIGIMNDRTKFYAVKLHNLSRMEAQIVKQGMLSKGSDAAVNWQTIVEKTETTDLLLFGTLEQFKLFHQSSQKQPFTLPLIAEIIMDVIRNYEMYDTVDWHIREKKINLNSKTIIMGVLNVTPDSFSDGGKFFTPNAAIQQAKSMIEFGADIIDIGGESSRPNAPFVSSKEEVRRIIPIIKTLRKEFNDAIISVDTYKPSVAEEALNAGADIINDITALSYADDEITMIDVVKKHNCPVIIMHMQGTPQTMQNAPHYDSLPDDIIYFFRKTILKAMDKGINKNLIAIDPGIGFGKTLEHNLILLKEISSLKTLGCPILLGTSRKSMIGKIMGKYNLNDNRLYGTISTNIIGMVLGANILRVHDVEELRSATVVGDEIYAV